MIKTISVDNVVFPYNGMAKETKLFKFVCIFKVKGEMNFKFLVMPMGVPVPGSAHARPST